MTNKTMRVVAFIFFVIAIISGTGSVIQYMESWFSIVMVGSLAAMFIVCFGGLFGLYND